MYQRLRARQPWFATPEKRAQVHLLREAEYAHWWGFKEEAHQLLTELIHLIENPETYSPARAGYITETIYDTESSDEDHGTGIQGDTYT